MYIHNHNFSLMPSPPDSEVLQEMCRNKQKQAARLGQSPALPPPVPGALNQEQPQFPDWQAPSQTQAVLGRGKDTTQPTISAA